MRAKEVLRAVVGACLVYGAMAACAAHEQAGAAGEPNVAQDGATTLDALTNPVPEAQAGPAADVATEDCDKKHVSGATTYYFAEHAYPGKKLADLVGLRVTMHLDAEVASVGNGYLDSQQLALLKDGSAAVVCGTNTKPNVTVTFTLP